MDQVLAVLARSDSFADYWPRLAGSTSTELRVSERAAELGDLSEVPAVVLNAAGVEHAILAELAELRGRGADRICVVGAATEHRLVSALMQAGAHDYFALPGDQVALRGWVMEQLERIHRAERVRRLADEHRRRFDFSRMIGRSPCLTDALDRAARIIPHASATVLITGETGTGKELLARAIHYNGPRGERPFVEINCAALPDNLLEAELFGYEPGAFTDARMSKPGLFEVAAGGTLFLDEIGELSPLIQAKLLRALEERRTRRLGGVRTVDVDLRIIAATHVHLQDAVRERAFRQDLFYRLNVISIRLPSLRQRGDDVLLLAQHFLEHFCREYKVPSQTLSPEMQRAIREHHWPGNIRELKNAIERAVLMGDEGRISARDLFPDENEQGGVGGALPFPASLAEIEIAAAVAMLDQCGGNKTRAADRLGISRKYLYELLSRAEKGGEDGE